VGQEMTSFCEYGFTLMAEANGDLGYVCDQPPTKNTTEEQDGKAVSVNLCKKHYEEFLIWENERVFVE
jgi:hypothetical protein